MSSNLSRILSFLEPYCPGWQRSTGVRNLMGLVQLCLDELYDYDGPRLIWVGTDNKGFPPYLKTVAGTYEYEITAANLSCDAITKSIGGVTYTVRAKKVIRVFVDATNIQSTDVWLGAPHAYLGLSPFSSAASSRLWVQDVPFSCEPAAESQTCKIRFSQDPGTADDKYFCEFTWEPPRLTAETIRLPIEPKLEGAIHDYVIGTVQKFANGKSNEHLARFYTGTADHPLSWVEEFREGSRSNDQAIDLRTQARVC